MGINYWKKFTAEKNLAAAFMSTN